MALTGVWGITPDGKEIALEQVLELELQSDRFTPADSFVFKMLNPPDNAITQVKAILSGEIIFRGIVDTQKKIYGKDGIYGEFSCRSLFARLLDNEVKPYLYLNLTADELVRNHGRMYGITGHTFPYNAVLPEVLAGKGESHWEFICKFCRLAYGKTPYINREGELVLNPFSETVNRFGKGTGQIPFLKAEITEDRYRMISKLYLKTGSGTDSGGYQRTITNKIASDLGVVRERYYHPGEEWRQDLLQSGRNRIRERQLDYFEISLTIPGAHCFSVGELAEVTVENKRYGNLYLSQSRIRCGENGITTEVALWDRTALSWEEKRG